NGTSRPASANTADWRRYGNPSGPRVVFAFATLFAMRSMRSRCAFNALPEMRRLCSSPISYLLAPDHGPQRVQPAADRLRKRLVPDLRVHEEQHLLVDRDVVAVVARGDHVALAQLGRHRGPAAAAA